jgi:hypothetical protein
LFADGFRGLDPGLALCEANVRELRRLHYATAMLFEHAPVVHKSEFSEPIVSHASNLLQFHFGNNPVNT